jgi:hypothetical protein
LAEGNSVAGGAGRAESSELPPPPQPQARAVKPDNANRARIVLGLRIATKVLERAVRQLRERQRIVRRQRGIE